MALTSEKRLLIEKVIASFRSRLAQAHGKDAEWTQRYRNGDESAIDELIIASCNEHGLEHADYRDGIEQDAQLAELHSKSIREVLLGSLSPRPR